MTRLLVASGLLLWAGTALLLTGWTRLARLPLRERLAPFHPVAATTAARPRPAASIGQLMRSAAQALGDRLAAVAGVDEPLGVRLRRVHSPLDVVAFRTRQVGWMGAGLAIGLVAAAVGAPVPLAVLALAGGPVLAFLVVEQRLSEASRRWQDRVARELPVVAEQLAMLINAGYSLGAAVNRLAARGDGCCATDLRVVANRIRHGVGETAALREWAQVVRVDAVDRLVGMLALHTEAPDLGRLVSAEARQTRRDLQRRTTELIERRAEQVWIPVSVSTLVPGVILLAVPFLAALRLFANA